VAAIQTMVSHIEPWAKARPKPVRPKAIPRSIVPLAPSLLMTGVAKEEVTHITAAGIARASETTNMFCPKPKPAEGGVWNR